MESSAAPPRAVARSSKRYLTFRVARQDLAVEAARVRGILPLTELAPMPGVSPGILGMARFQGKLLWVVDLGFKLKLAHARDGARPKIVVLEVQAEAGPQLTGFVADRVAGVVEYHPRDLRGGSLHGQGRARRLVNFDELMKNDLAGASG